MSCDVNINLRLENINKLGARAAQHDLIVFAKPAEPQGNGFVFFSSSFFSSWLVVAGRCGGVWLFVSHL